jgi:hypothetical protein
VAEAKGKEQTKGKEENPEGGAGARGRCGGSPTKKPSGTKSNSLTA